MNVANFSELLRHMNDLGLYGGTYIATFSLLFFYWVCSYTLLKALGTAKGVLNNVRNYYYISLQIDPRDINRTRSQIKIGINISQGWKRTEINEMSSSRNHKFGVKFLTSINN